MVFSCLVRSFSPGWSRCDFIYGQYLGDAYYFWRNAILSLSCCVLSLVLLMPRLFACCNAYSFCSATSCYVLSTASVAYSLRRLPWLWFSLLDVCRALLLVLRSVRWLGVFPEFPLRSHERACELDLVMYVNASSCVERRGAVLSGVGMCGLDGYTLYPLVCLPAICWLWARRIHPQAFRNLGV